MSNARAHLRRSSSRRRGSVYIAVLGASLIVMTLAIGGILATRVQARGTDASNDAAEARLYAQSALELARLWISQDARWRSNRINGSWADRLSLGTGNISIDVSDPLDGDLNNRPHDSVQITAIGKKGSARQLLRQTLTARPVPLPALRYAIHTAGEFRIDSGKRLILGSATASTNGSWRNDGTVEGNADVSTSSSNSSIYGTLTTGVAARSMPESTVPEAYARLGTLINPSSTMTGKVLTPTLNPFGAVNADGVYVIRANSNLTIRQCRIYGTLVIFAPGKKVTIDQANLFQPARPDFPAIIIVGDCTLDYTSSTALTEAGAPANLNPTGAAYLGVVDSDQTDSYPNEIQGLLHVTGQLTCSSPGIVRGAIICESSASSAAVYISAAGMRVIYDSSLYTNPPQYYTTSVPMRSLAGSYKPVAE